MAFNLRNAVVATVATLALPAAASAQSLCSSQFFNGEEPKVEAPHQVDPNHAVKLCNAHYTVLYDVRSQDPIYSAEHLTREQVQSASRLHYVGRFDKRAHDDRVPTSPYARDYTSSGFEHGQMSASADAPTVPTQLETYKLTNIVPQTKALKFGPWLGVEAEARADALRDNDVYVVSGPAFLNGDYRTIGNHGDHIGVPSHTWKVIYDPKGNTVRAHICSNNAEPVCDVVPYNRLVDMTGVNAIPSLRLAKVNKVQPAPDFNDQAVFTHSPGDDWYDISADKTDTWSPKKDDDGGIDIDI